MRHSPAMIYSLVLLSLLAGCAAEPVDEAPQVMQVVVERTVEVTRQITRETTREVTREVTVVQAATEAPTRIQTLSRILLPTRLPTNTPTNTPVVTNTPTRTPLPTSTRTPTNTPTPTDSPRPTATLVPTRATPPPGVSDYLKYTISDGMETLGSSIGRLGALLQNPELTDEGWITDVAFSVMIVRMVHDEALAEDVPPEMSEIHKVWVSATSDFDSSMDYLVSGLDNRDADDLYESGRLQDIGMEKLELVTQMVEEYGERFK